MEVTNLFAILVTNNVAQPPSVIALRSVFRIPDYFVDEVAEMEHEDESILRRPLLILPDHPAVGRRGALLHVLTAHESEAHDSVILVGRRRDRAAHAAAEAMLVSKAVPVDARRFETGCQHTAGPVRLGGYVRSGAGDDTAEIKIIGDLDRQPPRLAVP